jgi:D-alanine-D-alanine ligase
VLRPDARIVVVAGGWSAEREVSLATGEAVAGALERGGYAVRKTDLVRPGSRLDAVAGLLDEVREFRADAVWIALHGPLGEDGTLQGMLELAGIPFNGSGVLASAQGLDKVAAKQCFVANRITTPRYALVAAGEADPEKPPLPLPVIVKPRSLGSSIGVSLVEKPGDLGPALAKVRELGQDALVEQYMAGREIQVCIHRGEALPLVEVISANRIYDYEAKYVQGKSEHHIPASLPRKQYEAAQKMGIGAYKALGCEGVARVELIAEQTGTLYALEVNTLPGMTMTSIVPEAAREAGISFLELVTRELEDAIARRKVAA